MKKRIQWMIGFVIFGLVVSGLTAFPLLHELNLLASWIDVGNPLGDWIHHVRDGLEAS
jgi:hypothetical protein